MKIAVTYENGQVFQHFGHTEEVKVYEVVDNEIKNNSIISTEGHGHGALATFLKEIGVEVLICGGIGTGAQNALTNAGIKFFGGVVGNADEVVNNYLSGQLEFNPNVACNHHEHHNDGCASHGSCENHKCH